MPTVGDRNAFAVEYELSTDHGGVWMFGKFGYWCGGMEVGDFDAGTSLRDVLFQLEEMRRDVGQRRNDRLLGMAPDQMARLLNAGLFGSRDLAPVELAGEEQWARHNIAPEVDIFDCWRVFLVEGLTTGRLVFGRFPFEKILSVEVRTGEVDRVLEAARLSLQLTYEIEAKSPGPA